ncbi:hypothetical protein [Agrobacterium sp. SORGH_AS 787]|uniref:hypothetical protein n=1 Tax=Agrobacterium sp. SORGH_AS 787 TaxID=3041775 RepID=UPI00278A9311|nr:hypothetical protein [Rhizobium sp. SORGH_AS_0787]
MTEPTEPVSGGRYVRSSETGEFVREPVEQPATSEEAGSEVPADDQAGSTSVPGRKGK